MRGSRDVHSHRARRPRDHLHRLVDVARVQVRHLRLGDGAELCLREPAHLLPIRLARALLDPERLLDENRGGRRLRDEREGAILEDRDLDRGDAAVLLRRLRVEGLAELHDVDPVLAERGADGRRRVGLTARDLELDQCEDFLGHWLACSRARQASPLHPPQSIFFTWSKLSSTGTWRSKMSTSTFSFCWSGLTSTISPSKSESGPDVTFTDSPSENSTWAFWPTAAGAPWCRMRSTSGCERGTGFVPAPTKPVTPGVPLTTVQASSDMFMLTST